MITAKSIVELLWELWSGHLQAERAHALKRKLINSKAQAFQQKSTVSISERGLHYPLS